MTFHDITNNNKKTYHITTPGRHVFFFRNKTADLTFSIEAEGADVVIFGFFEGEAKDRFELKTTQLHKAPRTTSSVLVKGIFRDQARLHYDGLIHIERAAQKSEAHLTNNNLLLSEDAFVMTKPMLEILPDDVICTHAATTGPLSEEQLHFLRTRGIAQTDAQALLVEGFIADLRQQVEAAQ